MDRRRFLQRMGAAASLAAASPLFGGAMPDSSLDEESLVDISSLTGELSNGFVHPPDSAAPWVFWFWLDVDTTPAAMTFDLEQMKAKGIGGFILYTCPAGDLAHEVPRRTILVEKNDHFEYQYGDAEAYKGSYTTPIPFPPLPAWTPLWRQRIRHVARESGRLGLKFCLTLGISGTSGQISEEYGNQKLIWTETEVNGLKPFDGVLPSATDKTQPNRREIAVLATPNRAGFPVSEIVDLTDKVDATGHLTWTPPAGDWKILRFSQIPTGAKNIYGYYSDGMSTEALDELWKVTMAPLLEEMSSEERGGMMGIEDDSWEAGECTWTKNFPEEFKKRRGYDLKLYLPVLAGADIADSVTRERVLRDYKLTISDLIADYHYGYLETLCRKNGLSFFSEAAGPNLHQADLLKNTSKADLPMAEFWVPSYHRPTPKSRFLVRNAACAGHVYGMPINMDEAFTSIGPEWEESPFSMKPVADEAFCDGVNRICIHNFSHSPSLTAKPGYVYIPGTHYDPRITWWDQSPAFNTYIARCSYLLQQGKFVADAIFYNGDNIGDGEPMKTIHPSLGEGFDYDCCNAEVVLTRMNVKYGRIVLPDGMSYRVLILPENRPMAYDVLQKVASLIENGATVVGPPPSGLPGLPVHSDEENRFNALVARLWGNDSHNPAAAKHRIGAGVLVAGQSARQTLIDAGITPDFEQRGLSKTGAVYWIHRKTEDADIYFVSSHWQPVEKLECTFRVSGKQPEIWDAVTGGIRGATAFHQIGNRTVVPLEFGPCGSTFVVFRKHISITANRNAATNYSHSEREALLLSGAWDVSFDPKWGGPEKIVFNHLVDWTTRPESGIKYYSGTAVYRKRFSALNAPYANSQLLLDLGELYEVASVRVNGHDLGVVWTRPARIDITGFVRAGDNDLEITVVNLWPNRLSFDATLPEESRLTKTNVHKFGRKSPLLPSGLVGPVRILAVEKSGP